MGKVRSFKDLRVWQGAVDFAVAIYKATEQFPKSETYGLSNQLRRASVSIASNVAEGHGRSDKEFARYLQMALGSTAEVETQLEIAHRVNYLPQSEREDLSQSLGVIGRQLSALRNRTQPIASGQRPTASRQRPTANG